MNTTNDNTEQRDETREEDGKRYERVSRPQGNYDRQNTTEGKRPRVRISRPRQEEDGREGGWQPRSGYQPRGAWQPRQNNYPRQYQDDQQPRYRQDQGTQEQGEGGYVQRPYQNRWQQNPRPRNNQEGGWQPRSGYQPQQRQGGYRPYNNNNNNQENRGAGWQPRYQNNNNHRPSGGYRPSGYNNNGAGGQDGYHQRRNQNWQPRPAVNMKKRIDYKEDNINPDEPIRLNKFLSNAGACSRREADTFIQAGVVKVNGQVVTELGVKVKRTDEVFFHDQPVRLEKKVYILLNKPKDYVTTVDDPQQRKTVMDIVRGACTERIYPVGRLDRNTTGVLLLTNDGELASKLTHPQFRKKKVYHVTLDKNVTAADMHKLAEGVELEDGPIRADAVEYASPTDKKQVGIEIHSGRNRIVRRMFEALGYYVTRLDRVQFCGLTKRNVRRGDWRFLTEREVDMLRMGAFE